jgi:hypothetical protein
MEMAAAVMCAQSVAIERQENIMEQRVVTDVKDSSGEVSEKITHIHVGKF